MQLKMAFPAMCIQYMMLYFLNLVATFSILCLLLCKIAHLKQVGVVTLNFLIVEVSWNCNSEYLLCFKEYYILKAYLWTSKLMKQFAKRKLRDTMFCLLLYHGQPTCLACMVSVSHKYHDLHHFQPTWYQHRLSMVCICGYKGEK